MVERGLNMSKLDNEEQKIYDMLSQINVDSSKIAQRVRTELHKRDTKTPVKGHKLWMRSTAAAIVLSMFLVVGATAAVLGNFEWFMKKFNPNFGEITEPIEVYCEEQGIRMEVIGAQKYDNRAVVYLSLKDITGQNRLTERTDFRDGFNVKMSERTKKTIGKRDESVIGYGWKQKMLYFDEATNTAYYEFNITTDIDTPLADPLELGSSRIYFDKIEYEEEPINIPLISIKDTDTVSINESQIWGGGGESDNIWSGRDTKVLLPGNYASMPHGNKNQWISNIGIIDGKLHVQIGKIFNKEFGPNDPSIDLKDQDGNLRPYDYSLALYADEKNNFLDIDRNDYSDAMYKYEEFIFPLNKKDLNKYTICYTGTVYTGVEGNWKVVANLSDSSRNIITWAENISIEGYVLEYMTLNPLGLQAMGTYEGEKCHISDVVVKIETVDGIIQLEGGGGSQDSEKHRFSSSWDTEVPIDIIEVIAIIINDTRIPIN